MCLLNNNNDKQIILVQARLKNLGKSIKYRVKFDEPNRTLIKLILITGGPFL